MCAGNMQLYHFYGWMSNWHGFIMDWLIFAWRNHSTIAKQHFSHSFHAFSFDFTIEWIKQKFYSTNQLNRVNICLLIYFLSYWPVRSQKHCWYLLEMKKCTHQERERERDIHTCDLTFQWNGTFESWIRCFRALIQS